MKLDTASDVAPSRGEGGSRVARKAAAAAVALATAGAAFAAPAAAHYVYTKAKVYASSTNCTGARSETSHGDGGGYSKADVFSWYRMEAPMAGGYDCESNWSRPAGYLATKYQLFKWDGAKWAECKYTDYYYNSSSTHQYAIYTNFGDKAPCGAGTYNTMATSYVLNGGQWFGGSVWSGNHTF